MSYWEQARRPDHSTSKEKWTVERFLLTLIAAAYSQREKELPLRSFGTYNALLCYLKHQHYSPFLPLPHYMTEEQRQKNIDGLIHYYRNGWAERNDAESI